MYPTYILKKKKDKHSLDWWNGLKKKTPDTRISSKLVSMHFCEISLLGFWPLSFEITCKWNSELQYGCI